MLLALLLLESTIPMASSLHEPALQLYFPCTLSINVVVKIAVLGSSTCTYDSWAPSGAHKSCMLCAFLMTFTCVSIRLCAMCGVFLTADALPALVQTHVPFSGHKHIRHQCS